MLLFSALLSATAIFAYATTDRAAADTIPINISFTSTDTNQSSFYFSVPFTLPAGFTNASLNITTFSVDDRAVLELNNSIVASEGIFGPGAGFMVLTSGGANNNFTFEYGDASTSFASITSGFVAGPNTLLLIVNNTAAGIGGNLVATSPANPTSAFLFGSITFTAPSAVPLPSALPLFATGLGALGLLGWRRKRKAQAA